MLSQASQWRLTRPACANIADGSEFDYYGSYAGEVGAIGYEVGYIAYRYSKDAASNLLNFY
jgi:hypothetical protein